MFGSPFERKGRGEMKLISLTVKETIILDMKEQQAESFSPPPL